MNKKRTSAKQTRRAKQVISKALRGRPYPICRRAGQLNALLGKSSPCDVILPGVDFF